jgi:hypothetical protein
MSDELKVRELTAHRVNECNEALRVSVLDEPGAGGANHLYVISGMDASTNPSRTLFAGVGQSSQSILFQNGPIPEVGTNGVTHESVLAVLIDRMQGFQKGPYACRENAIALTHLEEALMWLQKRTRQRLSRGVEGTHKV